MHKDASDFARTTTGTLTDRMNQMGRRFADTTPAQLAAVLHAVGAITYQERQSIEDNGFVFQQGLLHTGLSVTSARQVPGGYTCPLLLNGSPFASVLPTRNRNDSVVNAVWMVNHLKRGLVHTLADITATW